MSFLKGKDKHCLCDFPFQAVRIHSGRLNPRRTVFCSAKEGNQKRGDITKECFLVAMQTHHREEAVSFQPLISCTRSPLPLFLAKKLGRPSPHFSKNPFFSTVSLQWPLTVTVQKILSVTLWQVTGLVGSQHVNNLLPAPSSIILFCN